jgi:hypothetical protein
MRSPCCLCVSALPSSFYVFCAVHVISKGSGLLVLPRTSCLCMDSIYVEQIYAKQKFNDAVSQFYWHR